MSRETSASFKAIRNRPVRGRAIVLLAGFEPFDGGLDNPSQQVVERLGRTRIERHLIQSVTLPCTFAAAAKVLLAAIQRWRPGWVICLGLAGRRRVICPEMFARNLTDARIPDNDGRQPRRRRIRRAGPSVYRSTLPVGVITTSLRQAGVPARISRSAGGFVCNHVFYHLMHSLRHRDDVRAGFIHVPPLASKRSGRRGLTQGQLVRGIRLVIRVSLGLDQSGRAAIPLAPGADPRAANLP